ncbi:MAG: FAD-dependent oxidoreductase [Balneolales bacterium]
MIIGVIGSGLSGLTAGKTLADAGHEVTVFDKSYEYGGRMVTGHAGDNSQVKLDYGASYFQAESEEFKSFLSELEKKDLIKEWCDSFSFYNGETFYERHPGRERKNYYMAPNGMNSIGKYLSRYLDFRLGVPVSGLTFIGSNRLSKRNWMITLADINTFELDAIIVATPAPQAYGLIQTSQDELAFRKIIRTVSRVEYEPSFSLMASYGKRELPEWNAMVCQDERIKWISNETSKRENSGELGLVIKSAGDFAHKHMNEDPERVSHLMLENVAALAGEWARKPQWHNVHLWKYSKLLNPLKPQYLELEDHSAPAALIGDYFGDQSMETAYLSGLKLGQHWVEKFAMEKA